MNTGTLLLTLAYAFPLAMLALVWGRPTGNRTRLVITALLPVFYVVHYYGVQSLSGWPTDDEPQDGFTLLSEMIQQPNPKLGIEGDIYLWALDPGAKRPRAYHMPYERPLHERVAEAADRRNKGRTQIGARRPGAAGTEGDGREGSNIDFSDKPGVRAPPKDD